MGADFIREVVLLLYTPAWSKDGWGRIPTSGVSPSATCRMVTALLWVSLVV